MKVTIRESHRGLSRSSEYHFVLEDSKLIYISRYAVSKRKIFKDTVEYVIDLSKLRGKEVVEVVSSNSGIFCWLNMYPAEDLALEFNRRRVVRKPLSFINNYELAHLTYRERMFLQGDWEKHYIPMIKSLQSLITKLKSLNQQFPYVALTNLIQCQIESGANYPLSFLIPYSENARRKSLEALTKEIHQLWIIARMLVELAEYNRLKSLNLSFTQSSYSAIATFRCKDSDCSIWYEFDMNPHTMCEGMLWYNRSSEALRKFYSHVETVLRRRRLGRAPLRPDIVILEGGASCSDLVKGFRIRMIVECKNWDYTYWAKDVENQIIPYKEIFQPDMTVLASLKKVPEHVKEYLNRYGIIVVDEVYPGERGINDLLSLVMML